MYYFFNLYFYKWTAIRVKEITGQDKKKINDALEERLTRYI